MTDSPSSSFMDGHGPVQTVHYLDATLVDIGDWATAARRLLTHPAMYGAAGIAVDRIESLASGLVQELTLLRDKEEKEAGRGNESM